MPSNFKDLPPPRIFQFRNYFNIGKKFTHRRKHLFFDSKLSWIDRYNCKNYLIDNSEAYSEPSITSTVELFAKIFNGEKLFSGVLQTLVLIKSNTKITTIGKIYFVWNSLNLIFEKELNILRDSFKKCVEAFLTKISSFENESGIDSRSQVDKNQSQK